MPRGRLLRIVRLIVDGARPGSAAITRTNAFCRNRSAMWTGPATANGATVPQPAMEAEPAARPCVCPKRYGRYATVFLSAC